MHRLAAGRLRLSLRRLTSAWRFAWSRSSSWSGSTSSSAAMPGAGEDPELGEFLGYMESLKNYERAGIPRGAGTDSDEGFDLGRMRRLLQRLGDPQSHFRAVHIAGTKGKGSTAAFLSTILRQEGYSVGCYTSPHLLTIRERISVGRSGSPVSAKALNYLFHLCKEDIDKSLELENGALTHYEVFTALAFALFSQENVDIAIIETGLGGVRDATNVLSSDGLAASIITTIGEEHLAALGGSLESIAMAKSGIIKHRCPLVIGGPFESHIEQILRNKASSLCSPVVAVCDPGVQGTKKGLGREDDRPYQSCDIFIQIKKDLQLFIELSDVKLHMLGDHQLQNAITATCAALCLRNQGWQISDKSIHAGLERTVLPGRSQFLTCKETEAIGLSGVSILIDGAHTEASAKSLADTIQMTCADKPLALVIAMASDKDHLAFAKQFLSGLHPEMVLLMEVSIAGGKSRMTSSSTLKDAWVSAAVDLGIHFLDVGIVEHREALDDRLSLLGRRPSKEAPVMLVGCKFESLMDSMKAADKLLKSRAGDQSGLIVVTGSFHIVSSVLASVNL